MVETAPTPQEAREPVTVDQAASMIGEHDAVVKQMTEVGPAADSQERLDAARDRTTAAARELGDLGIGSSMTSEEVADVENTTGLAFGKSVRVVDGPPPTVLPRPKESVSPQARPRFGTRVNTGNGDATVVGSRDGLTVVRDGSSGRLAKVTGR